MKHLIISMCVILSVFMFSCQYNDIETPGFTKKQTSDSNDNTIKNATVLTSFNNYYYNDDSNNSAEIEKRNTAVEKSCNAVLDFITFKSEDELIDTVISANEEGKCPGSFAIVSFDGLLRLKDSGLLLNANSLPYIDYSDKWYLQDANNVVTCSETYGICSEFTRNFDNYYALFINKTKLSENGKLEDLDNAYSDKTLTWDYLINNLTGGNRDISVICDKNSFYSLIISSSGKKLLNYNDRIPEINYSDFGDKLFNDIRRIYLSPKVSLTENADSFINKHSDYLIAPISICKEILDTEFDWTIYPIPMVNDEQEDYYSYSNQEYYAVFFKSDEDIEFSAQVFDNLSKLSTELTINEYTNHFASNHLRDNRSAIVLFNILNNHSYDISSFENSIYNELYDNSAAVFKSAVIDNNTNFSTLSRNNANNLELFISNNFYVEKSEEN